MAEVPIYATKVSSELSDNTLALIYDPILDHYLIAVDRSPGEIPAFEISAEHLLTELKGARLHGTKFLNDSKVRA